MQLRIFVTSILDVFQACFAENEPGKHTLPKEARGSTGEWEYGQNVHIQLLSHETAIWPVHAIKVALFKTV